MGFNTTVLVLNDALHVIANDPDFGRRLASAISAVRPGQQIDVLASSSNHGSHGNAATVIETHHASHDVTVKIGGNRGEVVK